MEIKRVKLFQSTLPYGSDKQVTSSDMFMCSFQSTLPYGSDEDTEDSRLKLCISIHAPLRERHADCQTR